MVVSFRRLTIQNWRQFANVDLVFHNRLTILTGGNGAGKSTLLRILAQHFGWNINLLATPRMSSLGSLVYSSGFWASSFTPEQNTPVKIGQIEYTNDGLSPLHIPSTAGVQYNIDIPQRQHVEGVNISSHRPVTNYQAIDKITTNALGSQQLYQAYHQENLNRYQNSYTQFSPIYRMKEAIISMAMFGPGNEYVQRNETVLKVFEGFKLILKKVLPKYLGFRDISVRLPDVVLITDAGEFIIDASSGGIMSLIDLAWQIYLYSQDRESFVVCLDEPENHLHPMMQRSILQSLVDTFPTAQFIVATHSPFIVSSVRDSSVYVLRLTSDPRPDGGAGRNSFESLLLDSDSKVGTASEVLRDVLGVPVTMPEWAEDEIKKIAAEFTLNDLNADTLGALRSRLDSVGLSEFFSDAMKHVVANHDQIK